MAYTKVMQGSIDLANIKFPTGVYGKKSVKFKMKTFWIKYLFWIIKLYTKYLLGRDIDALARSYLWKSGLNYGHGTGHGIGYFLSVHEGIF